MIFTGTPDQRQIASRFGISQMQVSRWMTSALRRLRSRMAGSARSDALDETASA